MSSHSRYRLQTSRSRPSRSRGYVAHLLSAVAHFYPGEIKTCPDRQEPARVQWLSYYQATTKDRRLRYGSEYALPYRHIYIYMFFGEVPILRRITIQIYPSHLLLLVAANSISCHLAALLYSL